MFRTIASSLSILVLSWLWLLPVFAQGKEAVVALVDQNSRRISWSPTGDHWEIKLRVLDAVGVIAERTYGQGEAFSFDLRGLEDGSYRWELIAEPPIAKAALVELANAVSYEERRAFSDEAKRQGNLTIHPAIQSGTFIVAEGAAAFPERPDGGSDAEFRRLLLDDDQIIQGRQCVGRQCNDRPDFSTATMLVSDVDARLKFDDASEMGGGPNNDWELVANDGANQFAIRDCGVATEGNCSGPDPFTLEAGAPAAALYLKSNGNIGFGTSTPVAALHIIRSEGPNLRLEQAGAGVTPKAWDMAGNEASFIVRDVDNGTNPLTLRTGAPTDSLHVGANGNTGIGTGNPTSKLHVRGSDDSTLDDNTTRLSVVNDSAVADIRVMAQLVNNGGVSLRYDDKDTDISWQTLAVGNLFHISRLNLSGFEFTLDGAGNLSITGALTTGSDRESKKGIQPVDVDQVLASVASMPISTWSYKRDDGGVRHMGPMAQDFHAAFGLGKDERGIATLDASGVALAAIQALNRRIEDLKDGNHSALDASDEALSLFSHLADSVKRLSQRVVELEAALGQASGNR